VRGEDYVAVLDGHTFEEKARIKVPAGPSMQIFSPDGKYGYVCSSFNPETVVVSVADHTIVGHVPQASPFCPNRRAAPANRDTLLTIFESEGYAEPAQYGLKIEGWGVEFVISATTLDEEALARAIERELPIDHTGRAVRGRILRAEHFAARMLASNSPQYLDWAIALIEDEEVDLDVLDDIAARHGLERTYQQLCKVNGMGRYAHIDPWSRTSRYVQ
jgi:hypothetical protein